MQKYVLFSDFRTHQNIREEVNSSIMGLLAGSQMAMHLLRLTEGSDHLLAEVFPKIPHIKRFNLKTSSAREVLYSAERHLSAMAVPYVLAAHEDYMKACLMLVENHCNLNINAENIKSYKQHETLEEYASGIFSAYSLEQFHIVRLLRNCMIHSGGSVNNYLEEKCAALSPDARAGWRKLTGYDPDFKAGQRVNFSQSEVVAILAVTKNLAREANVLLQTTIERSAWAKILVEDILAFGPELPKDEHQRIRKLRGYARYYYSVLNFSETEVGELAALIQRKERGSAP